jgi:hypothetical protein
MAPQNRVPCTCIYRQTTESVRHRRFRGGILPPKPPRGCAKALVTLLNRGRYAATTLGVLFRLERAPDEAKNAADAFRWRLEQNHLMEIPEHGG